jgi:UDP-N-acetylglucosamine 2-epimerase
VQVIYPVHLNPIVYEAAHQILSGIENVFLTQPLDYQVFVYAMTQAYFIITDPGGIQEEAPALGKPLLITRGVTERPEAVLAGTGLLVGTDPHRLMHEAGRLLNDAAFYKSMSRRHNAFGDGHAAHHILKALKNA